jgi:hypothetical protein
MKIMIPNLMNDLQAKTNKIKLPLTSRRHSHVNSTFLVFLSTKGFCETIGNHLSYRNILNPNDFVLNGFTDEMMTDVDMLSMTAGYRILCKRNGALIIREEIRRGFVVQITVTV